MTFGRFVKVAIFGVVAGIGVQVIILVWLMTR